MNNILVLAAASLALGGCMATVDPGDTMQVAYLSPRPVRVRPAHHVYVKPVVHHAPARPAVRHVPARPAVHHASVKPGTHHGGARPTAHHGSSTPGTQAVKPGARSSKPSGSGFSSAPRPGHLAQVR